MTTPGGVSNVPPGALTLETMESDTQDMSGNAMKARAIARFPSIMDSSTGLSPVSDLTPFGVLTRIWAETNSVIANADPVDVQGPDDIPDLLLDFITGIPVVGRFVELLQAIMGTYDGEDAVLLAVQALFAPIRALLQTVANVASGVIPTPEQVMDGFQGLVDTAAQAAADLAALIADLLANPAAVLGPLGDAVIGGANTLGGLLAGTLAGFGSIFTGWSGQPSTATTIDEAVDEAEATMVAVRTSVAGGFTLQTFTASNPTWSVPPELAIAAEAYVGVFGGGGKGANGNAATGGGPANGGAGGSSGGYRLEKIDPSTLASTLAIVVGAGASTALANGGTSSITSGATVLVQSAVGVGRIADMRGALESLSLPGRGGHGGGASTTAAGEDGEPGGDEEPGGTGGTDAFSGSTSATAGNGGAGTAGQTSNVPMSGGSGGGGGGSVFITGATGHAQGGAGGAGGFPGGGSGGGGGASASNFGTSAGGAAGAPAHGLAFILWR